MLRQAIKIFLIKFPIHSEYESATKNRSFIYNSTAEILIFLTLAVPPETAARLTSIQYVVFTVNPLTIAFKENGTLTTPWFPPFNSFTVLPAAVPDNAAPFEGA